MSNPQITSEELLDILTLSKDATAVYTSEELYIRYANDTMIGFWGKRRSVVGMRFEDAIPELKGQPFTALLKEVWRTGETYIATDTPAELKVDGQLQIFYFDFIYRALVNDEGKTYAILHTATEVTERMTTQNLLAEKQQREQQLNEELAAANEEYQVTNEELQSLNEEYLALNEEMSATNEQLKEAYDTLEQTHIELELTGSRLQQLISTSPVGMGILDGGDLVVAQANHHLLGIWRRTIEQVAGKKLMDIFPELAGQPFPEMLRGVLATGNSVSSKEIAVDISDSEGRVSQYYVDFAYEPLRDHQGNVTSVLVTVSDITEIVRTRQQLSASENLLKELNEELGAANEEYQATNEELQQLNEENTALNEELRSTNEQLYTISQQLEKANTLLQSSNAGLRLDNAALLVSETKALALFADAPVAIGLLAGRELIIESANVDLLRLWGKSAAVIGLPLSDGLPELKGQPFLDILDNVFTSGEPFYGTEAKAQLVHDGKLTDRYFNFVYKPVKNEEGHTVYIMIVATDVTPQVATRVEIERAEEKFRLVADNISQLAWMADANGDIYWYNQRWFDYTGTTLEEMYGWGWQKVHDPEQVDRVVEKLSHHYRSGEPWEDTFPLRRHDGEYRWFLSRAVPARDEQGKIVSWFGTNTDITEQRKMDEQKDDFISIASHELKTPLTSLRANLQLLERMKDNLANPMAPKMIAGANKSMLKINALVDDLLNINRFSEGRLQLHKTHFQVWEMLELCCNHVRAEQKYELIIQGDKQIELYADEHRIDQVVVNFVNNAVKYASGSKTIWLIIGKLEKEIKIAVRDNGPGIPEEQLPHLFERYWRADSSGQNYSGLGLGLFICAEIVRRHGGRIGAESVLGQGATFWFTIPVA